jgi:acyl-CoA synthetase (AMP-forming)/AMP-acid ligase II
LAVLDDDGFLTLKDRSKDVIISGGANIYPREVEEVLLQHAAVAEVSVVGRPSAEWGEEVVAFVVCRPGLAAPRWISIGCACNRLRASSGRRTTFLSPPCRRTTTARC